MMNNPDMEAKVLATTIVGSLAYGKLKWHPRVIMRFFHFFFLSVLGGQKLIPLMNQYNLFDMLLTLLESNDAMLIDAACRTLKTISQYDFAAKSHVFQVSLCESL